MRKIILIAAPLALVACSQEAVEEPVVEETAAEVEAPAMVTANGTMPGTFTVTMADGTQGTSVLNADGTFQDLDAEGALVREGSWNVTDGKTCFTDSAEGGATLCWSESVPGADGSFTATSDNGDEATIAPAGIAPAAA